jgi:hypothetical protein
MIGSSPTIPPPLPPASCLSFSISCVSPVELSDGGEGRRSYHTTARKPCPLYIIQYSLIQVHFLHGLPALGPLLYILPSLTLACFTMFKSSQASFQHSPSSIIADFAIIPEAVSLTFRQVSVGLCQKTRSCKCFSYLV